jgi:hypothetical protein
MIAYSAGSSRNDLGSYNPENSEELYLSMLKVFLKEGRVALGDVLHGLDNLDVIDPFLLQREC